MLRIINIFIKQAIKNGLLIRYNGDIYRYIKGVGFYSRNAIIPREGLIHIVLNNPITQLELLDKSKIIIKEV